MQYLKINLKNIKKDEIGIIVDYLSRGKIIAYPTDTVYGLGCDATKRKAVEKIFKIKKTKIEKKEKNKGLIILIKSYCALHDYCHISSKQEKYIRQFWPPTTRKAHDPSYKYKKQPTTFILKGRPGLAKNVYGPGGSLAVRLPKNDFLTTILKGIKNPLISTSLNISGQPVLADLRQAEKYFKKFKPDLVIDAGKSRKTSPSRLIDIRNMDDIKVLRK